MRPRTRRALLVAATPAHGSASGAEAGVREEVEALGSALTDAAFDEVRALDDPGRTRMLEEVRSFFAVAEPTDVLLLALHGTVVRGSDGAVCFPTAPGRRFASGAVRLDAVSEVIQSSPARATVVLLDCGYSGWFDDGPDGCTLTVPQLDLRRSFPGEGCTVFAAAGGHRGAEPLSLGVARALRGAAPDRDGDGWIDTADLDEYLRRNSAADHGPVLVTEAPPVPLARRPCGPASAGWSAGHEAGPDPRSLLTDLAEVEGLDVARFGDTALASLTHVPEPGRAEPAIPVSAVPVSEAHHKAVESAMTRRLTVVAAPPGNGAGTLATAAAHTAVASGQSVLFVASDTASADAFTVDVRTELETAHLVAGGAVAVPARGGARSTLQERRALKEEETEARTALYRDWAAVCVARAAIDAIARIERDLALLAEARGQIIAAGWDPGALFRGSSPQEWLRWGEQAAQRFPLRPLRRSGAWRRLAAAADPAVLARVCQIARVEQEWRTVLDTRRRATSLEELYADLVAALEAHRRSSAAYLAARARARGTDDTGATAPVWAVAVGRAHELPPRAGMFDLVIVDRADRCGIGEVLPLLYRARRALVIGDPAAPPPVVGANGRGPGTVPSAYRALARVRTETGGRVLWLDEHDRCQPAIAALADRYCYGGRATVLTDPWSLPGDADRPVQWHDVTGEYEEEDGGSYVNREEAHRVAAVLTALDVRLPHGATVGVTSPFSGQRDLLGRLTGRRRYSRRIRIDSPHAFGAQPCDALVVSPVLSGSTPHRTVARTLAGAQWWHPLLTGAIAQLVVVGDRRFWEEGGGVPAAVAEAAATGTGEADGPAVPRPLLQALGDLSAEVETGAAVAGYRVDLAVAAPGGRVLVLVDRTRDGRGLRRLLDRQQRLREVTNLPVLRVPLWRCLHDPVDLAKEILLGRA
ncbi:DEAD/DEAH box helicase [Thermobifida cellulosilytica]|uniref:DNA/RNA helicase n=1 Tax=Thermobifida cellulosilytica TB100 TaxID=665004 RepID=A0A147KIB9_THECS|nr:AAA domain-containing protein [Thermobifida cellulosilytica]KUP97045.1 DNA/RNA helicase [Thermobifida cellulosilytica TB100]